MLNSTHWDINYDYVKIIEAKNLLKMDANGMDNPYNVYEMTRTSKSKKTEM